MKGFELFIGLLLASFAFAGLAYEILEMFR